MLVLLTRDVKIAVPFIFVKSKRGVVRIKSVTLSDKRAH